MPAPRLTVNIAAAAASATGKPSPEPIPSADSPLQYYNTIAVAVCETLHTSSSIMKFKQGHKVKLHEYVLVDVFPRVRPLPHVEWRPRGGVL